MQAKLLSGTPEYWQARRQSKTCRAMEYYKNKQLLPRCLFLFSKSVYLKNNNRKYRTPLWIVWVHLVTAINFFYLHLCRPLIYLWYCYEKGTSTSVESLKQRWGSALLSVLWSCMTLLGFCTSSTFDRDYPLTINHFQYVLQKPQTWNCYRHMTAVSKVAEVYFVHVGYLIFAGMAGL